MTAHCITDTSTGYFRMCNPPMWATHSCTQSGRAHAGGSPPSISNETPCCPATVVDRAAVDVNHSRQEFNLWLGQLFDRHTPRHAVAANHIFQQFTWAWARAQRTPWLNISYVNYMMPPVYNPANASALVWMQPILDLKTETAFEKLQT